MESKEFDRDKAVIEVLLKQYEFLRNEVTQCIYLEHLAIIGLYTFLGWTVAILINNGIAVLKDGIAALIEEKAIQGFSIFGLIRNINLETTFLFLFALILTQIIVCGFGSLFLKEQARNRRACSFLKAIEYLINERIGEIGIYWENYITSRLIAKELKLMDYFRFKISVNPEYYKNRFLSVGLPVFLPNLLVTSAVWIMLYALCVRNNLITPILFTVFVLTVFIVITLLGKKSHKTSPNFFKLVLLIIVACSIVAYSIFYVIHGRDCLILLALFTVSSAVTLFWASMIMSKSKFPLKVESVPKREKVLEWLRKEQSKVILTGVSSTFTIENNVVTMEVKVVRDELNKKIYDIEIFPEDQDPPWESVEGIKDDTLPSHWEIENKDKRVRFYTENNPLKKNESREFKFKVQSDEMIEYIKIHLTDRNHRNRGETVSQQGISSTFTIRDDVVEMEIRVVKDELNNKIYDIEIFPEDQDPPWESVEGIKDDTLPKNWHFGQIGNGVRFYTKTDPLVKCAPGKFKFRVRTRRITKYIKLHLAGKDDEDIGRAMVLSGNR